MKNGNSYKRLSVLLPADCARAAGLRHVSDAGAGIARERCAGGFRYVRPDGKTLREGETLRRIRSLAIPPAWREVWICPREDGHLQATGRDARGRKQYRYHPRWRKVRDEAKYGRLAAFARALPRIRRRVRRDLAAAGLPREKVLALVVRLLETTLIRVGNEAYARENASFGLTTLRDRQVRVDGATMSFRFRGKSGVPHHVAFADRRLARIVRRMRELPGYELFQYVDEQGTTRSIESGDVNDYLKAISGEELTSKDFRTWAGTVLCARALAAFDAPASAPAAGRALAQAVAAVARQLGNTATVCRKCYIHPAVIESYLEGRLRAALHGRSAEAAVLSLLAGTRVARAERALDPAPELRTPPGVSSVKRRAHTGAGSLGTAPSR